MLNTFIHNVCHTPVLCSSKQHKDKVFVIWFLVYKTKMTTKQVHTISAHYSIGSWYIPVVVCSLGHVLRLLGDGGLAPSE